MGKFLSSSAWSWLIYFCPAILLITKFLLSKANLGFLLGLYLVGALIMPINKAASSTVRRSGSFWKKVLEALLTPNTFSLKGTVFK